MQLTELQIETIIAETCGTYRTGGSYTFEDVWNCIEKALAAHSAGAQAYPTIDHWLTELAGEREIGHVIQEMTHMEVARQAWAAARAMTDSAGAQEPVGTAVNDEELGRFWEMHKSASEFPVGTHVYTHPQPVTQTDAARDAFRALIAKVPHKPQAITYEKGWELLDELQRIAEIERIDWARGSDER